MLTQGVGWTPTRDQAWACVRSRKGNALSVIGIWMSQAKVLVN